MTRRQFTRLVANTIAVGGACALVPLRAAAHERPRPAPSPRPVTVNGALVEGAELGRIARSHRLHIPAGDYWYDRLSGGWGHAGRPTAGFVPAGLALGGRLREDASAGDTGVFVNERELPGEDVWALREIIPEVPQGRYWLNAYGEIGYPGGPGLLNLAAMARRREARGVFRRCGLAVAGDRPFAFVDEPAGWSARR